MYISLHSQINSFWMSRDSQEHPQNAMLHAVWASLVLNAS